MNSQGKGTESMKDRPEFAPDRGETCFGMPAMKPGHHRFAIGTAFSLLSVSAGAQILSALVDILADGKETERDLVKLGRYMGLAGSATAPLLYILDLHTPQRWFNMLRIFRKLSLMSIGSGALSAMTLLRSILEESRHEKTGKRGGRPEPDRTQKGMDAFAILTGIMELLVYAHMRDKLKPKVSEKLVHASRHQTGWSGGAIALGIIAPLIVRSFVPGRDKREKR